MAGQIRESDSVKDKKRCKKRQDIKASLNKMRRDNVVKIRQRGVQRKVGGGMMNNGCNTRRRTLAVTDEVRRDMYRIGA